MERARRERASSRRLKYLIFKTLEAKVLRNHPQNRFHIGFELSRKVTSAVNGVNHSDRGIMLPDSRTDRMDRRESPFLTPDIESSESSRGVFNVDLAQRDSIFSATLEIDLIPLAEARTLRVARALVTAIAIRTMEETYPVDVQESTSETFGGSRLRHRARGKLTAW
jgi:hypothetical protein